jgi:hypothetical protein
MDLQKLNDVFLHHMFPTPFIDEVLENVGGHESYSFTDGFSRYDGLSGYHHNNIAHEDRNKKTFVMEWECYQYTIIPFGLKNESTVFSQVVVVTFK